MIVPPIEPPSKSSMISCDGLDDGCARKPKTHKEVAVLVVRAEILDAVSALDLAQGHNFFPNEIRVLRGYLHLLHCNGATVPAILGLVHHAVGAR